jgi:hypothetical protein
VRDQVSLHYWGAGSGWHFDSVRRPSLISNFLLHFCWGAGIRRAPADSWRGHQTTRNRSRSQARLRPWHRSRIHRRLARYWRAEIPFLLGGTGLRCRALAKYRSTARSIFCGCDPDGLAVVLADGFDQPENIQRVTGAEDFQSRSQAAEPKVRRATRFARYSLMLHNALED